MRQPAGMTWAMAMSTSGAVTDEDRHQTAMVGLMGRMGQTHEETIGEAGSYSCPMHGGH